jgi:hypothetical protein
MSDLCCDGIPVAVKCASVSAKNCMCATLPAPTPAMHPNHIEKSNTKLKRPAPTGDVYQQIVLPHHADVADFEIGAAVALTREHPLVSGGETQRCYKCAPTPATHGRVRRSN